MKILPAFTLFSFLALFCCFLGVSSKGPREDECDKYPRPVKGKPLICTEEYAPVCGTNGKTYSNKCLFCAARWKTGENIGIKKEGKCEEKDECSEFPEPPKGKPAPCTLEYRPVCGSNGVTYGNKCAFCAAKRQSGGKITIKHEGQCEQKDECSEFPEPPKGKPAPCTLEYRPVCGSNGVTYGNKCAFCAAKRQSGGNITIKHEGQCEQKDECSEFPEPPKGKPAPCTLEYRPVCGSNGVTYGNKCAFCAAKRQSGGKITIKHEGQCEQKDECSEFPEPPKGKPARCTLEYRPVCGSNGVTYGNMCDFCAAKRQSGGKITIKHEGQCEQKDVCSEFPKPLTFCTKEYNPVCGTDGSTYGNKCMLCLARQETGKDIDVKHKGKCEEKDECSEFPEPPKGKPAPCTLEYRPVCGSNGVTYGNKCAFCAAKRQSGGKITIKHEGQCEQKDVCSEFPKPLTFCTKEYNPVCGTDGSTYGNKCMLCLARQQSGGNITIKHEGQCEQKPDDCKEPEKGKLPKCTREYQPVCGTNQVTYANKCLFCEARRESQGTIEIQHEGECNKKGK